jgi:hypothetical protein
MPAAASVAALHRQSVCRDAGAPSSCGSTRPTNRAVRPRRGRRALAAGLLARVRLRGLLATPAPEALQARIEGVAHGLQLLIHVFLPGQHVPTLGAGNARLGLRSCRLPVMVRTRDGIASFVGPAERRIVPAVSNKWPARGRFVVAHEAGDVVVLSVRAHVGCTLDTLMSCLGH